MTAEEFVKERYPDAWCKYHGRMFDCYVSQIVSTNTLIEFPCACGEENAWEEAKHKIQEQEKLTKTSK